MKSPRLTLFPVAAALLVVAGTGHVAAQKKDKGTAFKLPDNVLLERDVVFGKGGTRDLKMHILRPKQAPSASEGMPVLVWIHGGGWQAGSRDSGIPRLAPYAARGYFCASVEYRLSQEAIFPAQIEDCKCAIRYLRAHAKKYNLDPNRIGVWGSSAGGHLVALLGTSADVKELEGNGGWSDQSSAVQAVCDFCGPTDFVKIAENTKGAEGPVAKLFGGPPAEKITLAKLASPLTHVSKKAAPFLIVHGDQDKVVPMFHADSLNEALKKVGVPVTLHVAKGQGHGLGGPEVEAVVREFFDRTLRVAPK